MRIFVLLFLSAFWLFAKPYNETVFEKITKQNHTLPFSFVVMGDNRDGDEVLKRIIKKLDRSDIRFAVNNGDLTSDGHFWQFEEYLEIVKESKKPILSVIGNHEIPFFFGDRGNFKKYIGRTYFSFSYANSYFIALDNAGKKRVENKQLQWLENELKNSRKFRNRFVFLHVPLFDPREGTLKKGHSMKDVENARKLLALFQKYRVSMVFASHIHTFLQGKWGNVPFIITGGAGAPNSRDNGFYHYIVVDVNKEGVSYRLKRL